MRHGIPLLLLVLASLPLGAADPSDDLAGTWRLVEQTYGDGANNLADSTRPLYVEWSRGPSGWAGKIRAGEGAPVDWPAFANDAGLLPVEVVELGPGPDGGVRAVYRVRPAADDPLVLRIEEAYALDPSGDLRGTLRVRFTTPDGERGSFVLHRRFERVP
jgi:hypothetical protein